MLLALTCALCTVQPLPTTMEWSLLEPKLSLQEAGASAPIPPLGFTAPKPLAATQPAPSPLPLASLPLQDNGSGDGEHSDHMGPMWIVMGAMMVVMMVGMGVYVMSHQNTVARPFSPTALASPAMLAIPVMSRRGG